MTEKRPIVSEYLTVQHHLNRVLGNDVLKKSLTPSGHLGTLGSGGGQTPASQPSQGQTQSQGQGSSSEKK